MCEIKRIKACGVFVFARIKRAVHPAIRMRTHINNDSTMEARVDDGGVAVAAHSSEQSGTADISELIRKRARNAKRQRDYQARLKEEQQEQRQVRALLTAQTALMGTAAANWSADLRRSLMPSALLLLGNT